MTERQLQFRVGLLVIGAGLIGSALVVQFGDLQWLWKEHYVVAVRFDSAPGIHPSSPVQMSGLTIGTVRDVLFDHERGGVTVVVDVEQEYQLMQGTKPRLVRSLLGDSTIEFVPGRSHEPLPAGAWLEGERPIDPMEIVARLESRTDETLRAFAATSDEWRTVAVNINNLMQTKEGNLDLVVERAAESLQEFNLTMRNANKMIGETAAMVSDPEMQQSIRQTLVAMPRIVEETQRTIVATRQAMESVNANLANVAQVTAPLAVRGESMVAKLDSSLTNLDSLLRELSTFSHLLSQREGTLQKLISNPALYRDLERSAGSLALVLRNLEPVVNDLRIFSDKIARHPELMGVGGAVSGSSGLKDPAGVAPVQASPSPTAERFRVPFQ